MKYIIIMTLLINFNFANEVNIQAFAIGIFDKNGNGENIQHLRFSKNDYNDICFSKVAVFGNIKEDNISVNIGNSHGHYLNSKPIYNKSRILIGKEITYKHFAVTKGYFEVRINNKIFDTKVFIK